MRSHVYSVPNSTVNSSNLVVKSPRKKGVDSGLRPYGCTVTRTAHRPWNTADFCGIARHVLGSSYLLSIVLIGDKRARVLNSTYRNKTKPTNVLSFPLSKHSGELFLNLARIQREAHRFGLSPQGHAKFLLIHGCLHLKGHTHGSTMEKAEKQLIKKFNLR